MHSCPGPWAEACLVPVSHDLEAEDLTVELSGPATLTNVQSTYLHVCLYIGSIVVRKKNYDNSGIRTWDFHVET